MSASDGETSETRPRAGRALDPLTSRMYDSLKSLANKLVGKRGADGAIDATELVHECYLRLARIDEFKEMDRAEFLALSSTLIRNILVDQARRKNAAKRGHGWTRITLSEISESSNHLEVDLVDLDQAMQLLAQRDVTQARIVELHFFGGLTGPEIAQLLEIPRARVHNEWVMARAWLHRQLFGD
ncbi:MAG: RNA polymerase sigma-70 factor (ECF subfamily) [Chlamydiales bacterium]|jgi:RNA polymerase sigma-70 factor (ECF subfamily)